MMENNIERDEMAIEGLLKFMSAPWWSSSARKKIKLFDGAVPFFGPFVDIYDKWDSTPGIYADAEPDATGTLANLTILTAATTYKYMKKCDVKFVMNKLKYITKTKIKMVSGFPNEHAGTIKIQEATGRALSGKAELDTWDGQNLSGWLKSVHPLDKWKLQQEWMSFSCSFKNMAVAFPGLYFNLYHCWSVYFRINDGISVRFPIDAQFALELFKDREKEPGKLRRDAMLHWVRSHLRKKRSTNTDYGEVRRYIRGKTQFFWRGFNCCVDPDADYMKSIREEKCHA